MKYTCTTEIDLPRDRVVELFDSQENMRKWQPTLLRMEPLEGEPGKEGAKTKLTYQMGKRELEMVETVTKRDLPERLDGTYDAKGVHNVLENHFVDKGNVTEWNCTSEFQFKGFMKIMGALMPGAFRKETAKHMKAFKDFAESEGEAQAS